MSDTYSSFGSDEEIVDNAAPVSDPFLFGDLPPPPPDIADITTTTEAQQPSALTDRDGGDHYSDSSFSSLPSEPSLAAEVAAPPPPQSTATGETGLGAAADDTDAYGDDGYDDDDDFIREEGGGRSGTDEDEEDDPFDVAERAMAAAGGQSREGSARPAPATAPVAAPSSAAPSSAAPTSGAEGAGLFSVIPPSAETRPAFSSSQPPLHSSSGAASPPPAASTAVVPAAAVLGEGSPNASVSAHLGVTSNGSSRSASRPVSATGGGRPVRPASAVSRPTSESSRDASPRQGPPAVLPAAITPIAVPEASPATLNAAPTSPAPARPAAAPEESAGAVARTTSGGRPPPSPREAVSLAVNAARSASELTDVGMKPAPSTAVGTLAAATVSPVPSGPSPSSASLCSTPRSNAALEGPNQRILEEAASPHESAAPRSTDLEGPSPTVPSPEGSSTSRISSSTAASTADGRDVIDTALMAAGGSTHHARAAPVQADAARCRSGSSASDASDDSHKAENITLAGLLSSGSAPPEATCAVHNPVSKGSASSDKPLQPASDAPPQPSHARQQAPHAEVVPAAAPKARRLPEESSATVLPHDTTRPSRQQRTPIRNSTRRDASRGPRRQPTIAATKQKRANPPSARSVSPVAAPLPSLSGKSSEPSRSRRASLQSVPMSIGRGSRRSSRSRATSAAPTACPPPTQEQQDRQLCFTLVSLMQELRLVDPAAVEALDAENGAGSVEGTWSPPVGAADALASEETMRPADTATATAAPLTLLGALIEARSWLARWAAEAAPNPADDTKPRTILARRTSLGASSDDASSVGDTSAQQPVVEPSVLPDARRQALAALALELGEVKHATCAVVGAILRREEAVAAIQGLADQFEQHQRCFNVSYVEGIVTGHIDAIRRSSEAVVQLLEHWRALMRDMDIRHNHGAYGNAALARRGSRSSPPLPADPSAAMASSTHSSSHGTMNPAVAANYRLRPFPFLHHPSYVFKMQHDLVFLYRTAIGPLILIDVENNVLLINRRRKLKAPAQARLRSPGATSPDRPSSPKRRDSTALSSDSASAVMAAPPSPPPASRMGFFGSFGVGKAPPTAGDAPTRKGSTVDGSLDASPADDAASRSTLQPPGDALTHLPTRSASLVSASVLSPDRKQRSAHVLPPPLSPQQLRERYFYARLSAPSGTTPIRREAGNLGAEGQPLEDMRLVAEIERPANSWFRGSTAKMIPLIGGDRRQRGRSAHEQHASQDRPPSGRSPSPTGVGAGALTRPHSAFALAAHLRRTALRERLRKIHHTGLQPAADHGIDNTSFLTLDKRRRMVYASPADRYCSIVESRRHQHQRGHGAGGGESPTGSSPHSRALSRLASDLSHENGTGSAFSHSRPVSAGRRPPPGQDGAYLNTVHDEDEVTSIPAPVGSRPGSAAAQFAMAALSERQSRQVSPRNAELLPPMTSRPMSAQSTRSAPRQATGYPAGAHGGRLSHAHATATATNAGGNGVATAVGGAVGEGSERRHASTSLRALVRDMKRFENSHMQWLDYTFTVTLCKFWARKLRKRLYDARAARKIQAWYRACVYREKLWILMEDAFVQRFLPRTERTCVWWVGAGGGAPGKGRRGRRGRGGQPVLSTITFDANNQVLFEEVDDSGARTQHVRLMSSEDADEEVEEEEEERDEDDDDADIDAEEQHRASTKSENNGSDDIFSQPVPATSLLLNRTLPAATIEFLERRPTGSCSRRSSVVLPPELEGGGSTRRSHHSDAGTVEEADADGAARGPVRRLVSLTDGVEKGNAFIHAMLTDLQHRQRHYEHEVLGPQERQALRRRNYLAATGRLEGPRADVCLVQERALWMWRDDVRAFEQRWLQRRDREAAGRARARRARQLRRLRIPPLGNAADTISSISSASASDDGDDNEDDFDASAEKVPPAAVPEAVAALEAEGYALASVFDPLETLLLRAGLLPNDATYDAEYASLRDRLLKEHYGDDASSLEGVAAPSSWLLGGVPAIDVAASINPSAPSNPSLKNRDGNGGIPRPRATLFALLTTGPPPTVASQEAAAPLTDAQRKDSEVYDAFHDDDIDAADGPSAKAPPPPFAEELFRRLRVSSYPFLAPKGTPSRPWRNTIIAAYHFRRRCVARIEAAVKHYFCRKAMPHNIARCHAMVQLQRFWRHHRQAVRLRSGVAQRIAARTIRGTIRYFLDRRAAVQAGGRHRAACKIRRAWLASRARTALQHLRLHFGSALRIQRLFRGVRGRRRAAAARHCQTVLRFVWVRCVTRRVVLDKLVEREAVRRIQCVFRCFRARRAAAELRQLEALRRLVALKIDADTVHRKATARIMAAYKGYVTRRLLAAGAAPAAFRSVSLPELLLMERRGALPLAPFAIINGARRGLAELLPPCDLRRDRPTFAAPMLDGEENIGDPLVPGMFTRVSTTAASRERTAALLWRLQREYEQPSRASSGPQPWAVLCLGRLPSQSARPPAVVLQCFIRGVVARRRVRRLRHQRRAAVLFLARWQTQARYRRWFGRQCAFSAAVMWMHTLRRGLAKRAVADRRQLADTAALEQRWIEAATAIQAMVRGVQLRSAARGVLGPMAAERAVAMRAETEADAAAVITAAMQMHWRRRRWQRTMAVRRRRCATSVALWWRARLAERAVCEARYEHHKAREYAALIIQLSWRASRNTASYRRTAPYRLPHHE